MVMCGAGPPMRPIPPLRIGQIYPYVKNTGVYHCPADTLPDHRSTPPITARVRTYSINCYMNGEDIGNNHAGLPAGIYVVNTKTSQILFPRPSLAMVFLEEAQFSIHDGQFGGFSPAVFRGAGRSTNGTTFRPWSIAARILPLRTTMWSFDGGWTALPKTSPPRITPTPAPTIPTSGGCKTLWRQEIDPVAAEMRRLRADCGLVSVTLLRTNIAAAGFQPRSGTTVQPAFSR